MKSQDTELKWSSLRDRHCETDSSLGRIWIRLDRSDQVTGIYTKFGEIQKWVPDPGESLTLEDGKIQAEFLIAAAKAAKLLSEK